MDTILMLHVNGIDKNKGQSLMELLIAIGVFIILFSGIVFLILNDYTSSLLTQEMNTANFLAGEGIEVTKSIRDNSWDDLIIGEHGLAISENKWIFQGIEENISSQLRDGKRKIIVNTINSDKKEIISKVTWKLNEARSQEVILVTYLTNWQKILSFLPDVFFDSDKYSVSEDGGSVIIPVELSASSSNEISVDYITSDDTAMGCSVCNADCDYITASGTLNWVQGDNSPKTFVITICNDSIKETENETLNLFLINPVNVNLGNPSMAVLTIKDDDKPHQNCWGTGGSCDSLCQYANYGSLNSYYTNFGCTSTCPVAGSFYINFSGACSNNGTGFCYKMENFLTRFTSCSQGASCGVANCSGACTPCNNFYTELACLNQLGCRWLISPEEGEGTCAGTCRSCSNFNNRALCENQRGCIWTDARWNWTLSNSRTGYSSYASCTWY